MASDFDLVGLLQLDEDDVAKQDDVVDEAAKECDAEVVAADETEEHGAQRMLERSNSVVSAISDMASMCSSPRESRLKIGGQLIEMEKRARGAVESGVYRQYISAAGGTLLMSLLLLSLAIRQGFDVASQRWIAYWADNMGLSGAKSGVRYYLVIYAVLGFSGVIFVVITLVWVAIARIRASRKLHFSLLKTMLRAPMRFFDTTPIGRILNRFASDMYSVDITLPSTLFSYLTCLYAVVVTL
eukprot:182734_1